MGYRMEYGSWNKKATYRRYGYGKRKYIFLLIIPVLLAAYMYKSQVIKFLLPGDPEATKSAINTFVNEMKEGESVTDAFGTFCKVILDEASIS